MPRAERRTGRLGALAEHHAYTAFSSLGRLAARPVTAFMTITVIAIALALPAGLYVLVRNVQGLADHWEHAGEVSLFLTEQTTLAAAGELAERIGTRPDVAAVSLISADSALARFQADPVLADALEALPANPLPHVLVVTPLNPGDQARAAALATALEALEDVAFAQFDMVWLIRFNAMVDTARQLVRVIAALLALGVLLIVGNTIRLDIENRREEIEITRMLGGTDAFIRRPFLYSGLWYGAFGGGLALALITAALISVAAPTSAIAAAYGSELRLTGLDFGEAATLLGLSALVGLLGSWIAVGRHLAEIQPS